MSNRPPDGANAAGPWTTLWVGGIIENMLHEEKRCFKCSLNVVVLLLLLLLLLLSSFFNNEEFTFLFLKNGSDKPYFLESIIIDKFIPYNMPLQNFSKY